MVIFFFNVICFFRSTLPDCGSNNQHCGCLRHTLSPSWTLLLVVQKQSESILALMPKRLSYNCTLLIKNALIMFSPSDVKAYKRNNRLSVLNVTKHPFYCVVKSTEAAITLNATCLVSCLHHDQKVSYIAHTELVLFQAYRSKNNSGNVLAFKHFINKVNLVNVWNLRHGYIIKVVRCWKHCCFHENYRRKMTKEENIWFCRFCLTYSSHIWSCLWSSLLS